MRVCRKGLGLNSSVLAASLITIAVGPWIGTTAQVTVGKSNAKAQKPPATKPFTMERLLTGLQDMRNGDFTEPALIKRIAKYGVGFPSQPENLDRLRQAGASGALIEAVLKVAPAPPPPPTAVVKPKPVGSLELVCAPAECEVSMSGAPVRRTAEGKLHLAGLAEGDYSVSFSKQGFTNSELKAHVAPDRTTLLRSELKPTRATMESWGEQLREKSVQALGGELAVLAMKQVFANGDCTVWGQDGKPYPSSFQMLVRSQGKAFFRTRAGKSGFYEVDYLPGFQPKTNFPEQQARALDAGLHLVNDYQLWALLERMKRPSMTLVADSAVPGKLEDAVFHAESGTESFTVSLDADGRPKAIQQMTTLGKGVRAEYSDYKLEKSSYVPTRMMIVWPGIPRQGIAIHLVAVNLDPANNIATVGVVKKRRWIW